MRVRGAGSEKTCAGGRWVSESSARRSGSRFSRSPPSRPSGSQAPVRSLAVRELSPSNRADADTAAEGAGARGPRGSERAKAKRCGGAGAFCVCFFLPAPPTPRSRSRERDVLTGAARAVVLRRPPLVCPASAGATAATRSSGVKAAVPARSGGASTEDGRAASRVHVRTRDEYWCRVSNAAQDATSSCMFRRPSCCRPTGHRPPQLDGVRACVH